MKVKYRSIELFGISGCGKSYVRSHIKKKLEILNYKVYDSREMIILFLEKFVNLSLLQKFNFFIFKTLLIFNIKTTLWNKTLHHTCEIFLKNQKENNLSYKNIENFLYHPNNKFEKKIFYIWIKELLIASIIFNKISKFKKKKVIFFPDEGFVQKLFILGYSENKKISNIIKRFSKLKIFCDKVIFIKSRKKNIYKNHKKRRVNSKQWVMSSGEIKKMFNIEKKIKRYLSFIFSTIDNSNFKKLKNNIKKI